MRKIRVKNWEKFQHYKDRNPPWIKLHFALLSSEDWVMLADDSKLLAVVCMLVASKNDGFIPDNPSYLKRIAYLDKLPNLNPLIECGFLEILIADASVLQADDSVLQANARPETETETYITSSVPSLVCSEPKNSPPSQPEKKVAIELLATKNEVVKITFDEARQWQADFPAVDVPQQLREIRSWLGANPSRRKTARGMRRFIVTWLSKEQDKGRFGSSRATGPTTIAGAAAAALEEKRNDQFSFDAMEREQGQSVGRAVPAIPPLKLALPKLPE